MRQKLLLVVLKVFVWTNIPEVSAGLVTTGFQFAGARL
jgi:hypothetical protein